MGFNFQILKNDGLNNDVLRESEKYAEYKIDYKINLKLKPFITCSILPENYEVEFNNRLAAAVPEGLCGGFGTSSRMWCGKLKRLGTRPRWTRQPRAPTAGVQL